MRGNAQGVCKGPAAGRVWRLCKSPLPRWLQKSQASLVCLTKVSFAARAAAVASQSFLCCAAADQDNCQWDHRAKTDHRRR